ncbi:response regulator transcription factor [Actinomycetes bacterium M1A6_2h]
MKVLVVEDEELLGDTIIGGLEAEGHVAVLARDGVDGLWRACEQQFDVVVLDIMMPALNGYEVLRRMRAQSVWTPVMMLTAKDGDFDQTDAFDLGADDYLTKPFSFMVFLARLRALVRRGGPERPAILTAGELTLDPATRRVTRGGDSVTLTPREYALLEYFMRHQDRALTKTSILQNVWDAHYDGDDNVVEIYVGYLRRKIVESDGPGSIETLRGVGYRMVSTQS